jgi:hypothetical protein
MLSQGCEAEADGMAGGGSCDWLMTCLALSIVIVQFHGKRLLCSGLKYCREA